MLFRYRSVLLEILEGICLSFVVSANCGCELFQLRLVSPHFEENLEVE